MDNANLPAPQASFLGLNSGQWKSAITLLMATALGPIIEKVLGAIGIHLDPGGAADLIVMYGPTVAGVIITVARRAHALVLNDVVKILVARGQHSAAAVVQDAAAQVPPAQAKLSSHALVGLLGLLLCAGGLLGCTTAPDGTKTINTPTVATIAGDVGLIAGGLQNAMNGLPATGVNISPDTLTLAENALAGIKTVAANVAGVSSAADAQPFVQQLESYTNTFVASVGTALAPCNTDTCKQIKGYIAAANIVLPVIEIGVNMVAPITPPSAVSTDQARATLATPAASN